MTVERFIPITMRDSFLVLSSTEMKLVSDTSKVSVRANFFHKQFSCEGNNKAYWAEIWNTPYLKPRDLASSVTCFIHETFNWSSRYKKNKAFQPFSSILRRNHAITAGSDIYWVFVWKRLIQLTLCRMLIICSKVGSFCQFHLPGQWLKRNFPQSPVWCCIRLFLYNLLKM